MKVVAFFWLLPALLVGAGSAGVQDWAAADAAVVRLEPSAFPQLPSTLRQYLERRRCRVPQTVFNKAPHNVVTGRFTSASQVDVAVLCSRSGTSTILVFGAGQVENVAELGAGPDRDFLQVVGRGVVGSSRALGVATPSSMRQYQAARGRPGPRPLDHDGIEDAYVEKASVVWFWSRAQWHSLQGAD